MLGFLCCCDLLSERSVSGFGGRQVAFCGGNTALSLRQLRVTLVDLVLSRTARLFDVGSHGVEPSGDPHPAGTCLLIGE